MWNEGGTLGPQALGPWLSPVPPSSLWDRTTACCSHIWSINPDVPTDVTCHPVSWAYCCRDSELDSQEMESSCLGLTPLVDRRFRREENKAQLTPTQQDGGDAPSLTEASWGAALVRSPLSSGAGSAMGPGGGGVPGRDSFAP